MKLRQSLNNILKMVEKLNEIDTTGVEPLVYISDDNTPPRVDAVKHQVATKSALKNAPTQDDAFFKVPKVISK